MEEIRDRFKILAVTLKKVARGVFDNIFDEFCAEKHISVEEISENNVVQCKQVRAISESVRAIQREITCVKLNRVISENAAAGLQIWLFLKQFVQSQDAPADNAVECL